MEVLIVIRNHDYCLAARPQVRQQLSIEHSLEHRILIGGPLVKHLTGPVLQIRCEHGQKIDDQEAAWRQGKMIGT